MKAKREQNEENIMVIKLFGRNYARDLLSLPKISLYLLNEFIFVIIFNNEKIFFAVLTSVPFSEGSD
jgi:hypothetical protein